MSDPDAAADTLYGLPLDEFTGARDALVRQARQAGDREGASRIAGLRKPTRSAWLVNQLSRTEPERLERLLGIGDALRTAGDAPTADDLRELAGRRVREIGQLRDAAERLAEEAGSTAAESALREVETTLEAAVADPDAAGQVRAGRVVRALSYAGFGPAFPFPAPAPASAGRAGESEDEAAERRQEEERREAARKAEVVRRLTERRDELRGRVERARTQLADLESRLAAAEAELRDHTG